MAFRSRASLKDDPALGLDSRRSWVVLGFCSAILFLALATPRVSGVLFYGIVETFGVTRQRASWPVTLSTSLLHLSGPVTGMLCSRCSCRTILLTCSFTTGIAVSLCYFAQSIALIDALVGVVHGVTAGGVFFSINVIAAQHFEKRRMTAMCLMYMAGGINTMALPPLVDFFRTTYDVRSAFLLYGAILMNALPFALALRSPPWHEESKRNKISSKVSTQKQSFSAEPSHQKPELPSLEHATGEMRKLENDINGQKELHSHPGEIADLLRCANLATANKIKISNVIEACKQTLRPFLTLRFFVNAFTFSAVISAMNAFLLVSTDLVSDRGIPPSYAAHLLYVFSASDTLFRPVVGLVVDSKILSLEVLMLLCALLQAVAFELLFYFHTLQAMILASVVMGMTNGSRIAVATPTVVGDFGIELLPAVMGGVHFSVGLVLMALPAVIGLFRDRQGTYDGLFHTMAAVNALLFVVWAFRRHKNRNK